MTAPLSHRKRLKIIELFFEGQSYDQIAKFADVGKGSVEEAVRALRAGEYIEFQDVAELVDGLREISVFVNKHFDGDVSRCHTGSVAWVCLNRLGIEPSKVRKWAAMCEDLAPAEVPVQEFVRIAMWCWDLKQELGVDLSDLPQQVESLRGDAESLQAERDALKSEVKVMKGSVELLRAELGLLQDIDRIRKEQREEESRLAETRGRTKAVLTDAHVTEETVERFRAFAAAAKARGVPVEGELLDTLLELIASLGPQGIREVAELNASLVKEGLDAQEGVGLLAGLRRRGFTVRQASAIVRALSARGLFSKALNRLMGLLDQCETLDAAVATKTQLLREIEKVEEETRNEVLRLGNVRTNLRASIEELRRQGKEAEERSEKNLQEAAARYDKAQRKADERLRETEKNRSDIEERARKLAERNLELRAEIGGLNGQLLSLRGDVTDLTRQQAEAKARLEKALGVEGEWEVIERALRSAREKQRELDAEVQGERDTLTFAQHLKWTLGGDPRYARTVFAYYAQEPRILTDPNAPGERIVAKAFELLGSQAIRREEYERAEQRHQAEVGRLQAELDTTKTAGRDLNARIGGLEREKAALALELHGTKQRLEWSEEFRAKLVARQPRR